MQFFETLLEIFYSIVYTFSAIFDMLFVPFSDLGEALGSTLLIDVFNALESVPIIGNLTTFSIFTLFFNEITLFFILGVLLAYFFIP